MPVTDFEGMKHYLFGNICGTMGFFEHFHEMYYAKRFDLRLIDLKGCQSAILGIKR